MSGSTATVSHGLAPCDRRVRSRSKAERTHTTCAQNNTRRLSSAIFTNGTVPHQSSVFRGSCIKSVTRRTLVVRAAQAPATPPPSVSDNVPKDVLDVIIVGGGLSGLCVGQTLGQKHGAEVKDFLVTEMRERTGGNITTVSNEEGYLWEEGPNSFTPSDPILRMATDVGVADQLVYGDSKAPRFVLWDKELRPTPAGLGDLPFFTLLSPLGKIRAGLGAIGIKPEPPAGEESVEQFVRRNLGDEVFERLIDPFCSGVYAGDPARLSMEAAFGKIHRLEQTGGSMIGGTLKLLQEKKKNPDPPRDEDLPPKPPGQTVSSFRNGLRTLTDAIAKQINDKIRVNWKLVDIQKENGIFSLTYETPEGTVVARSRSVVITSPSYVTADLVRAASPEASDALKEIYYPPVSAVTLSYPKSSIREDRLVEGELRGFGQLHPRSQGITTLGTIYSSYLFPNRCPDGRVLVLNYIGGMKNQGVLNQSDDELVQQVDADLRTMIVKEDAPPADKVGVRTWPKAIPQFEVGHKQTIADARAALAADGLEGLVLGGNYVVGVALPRCVEGAYETAEELVEYLSKQGVAAGSADAEEESDDGFFV